jgi:uncharacterized RDD family membrane protein YckC
VPEDGRDDAPQAPTAPGGWLPPVDAPGPAAPAPPAPPARPAREAGYAPWPGQAPGTEPPVTAPLPAPWLLRVAAALVDGVVRFAILLAALLVATPFGESAVYAGLAVGLVLGSVVYPPWMIAARQGQTLGHMASGTRIVRSDGGRVGGRRAFAREVLAKTLLFEGAGGLFLLVPTLLNYLWPLWDDRNEALHDKLCATRVVFA